MDRQDNNKNPTILIIEDDPALSKMYTEKFRHEGFIVLTAPDGPTGLQAAIEKKPDIILLDILLPKFSGISILTQLREHPAGTNVTVIALSNLADRKEADKVLKLGAKEYLTKAMYTPEEIVEKVKEAVSRQKSGPAPN